MSGAVRQDSSPPEADRGSRLGVLRMLARIEALKTTKRLAFWVTTGIFAAFMVMFAIDMVRNAIQRPNATFALPDSWPEILQPPANIGPFFLGVAMILLFAPEFSWRTARQNVIDGLSKERFYTGKIIVLAALVALFLVIPIVIGGGGTLFSPSESSWPLVGPSDVNYLIAYVLGLLLWGSAAFMLAALLRSSGAAMGIMFVYLLVEQLLAQSVREMSETLGPATDFLPARVHTTLADPRLHYPQILAEENAMRVEQGRPLLEFHDFELLAGLALAFSAVFLITAFLSMRKRDL